MILILIILNILSGSRSHSFVKTQWDENFPFCYHQEPKGRLSSSKPVVLKPLYFLLPPSIAGETGTVSLSLGGSPPLPAPVLRNHCCNCGDGLLLPKRISGTGSIASKLRATSSWPVIWITCPSLQFPDFTLISNSKRGFLFHSTKGFAAQGTNPPGCALGTPGPSYKVQSTVRGSLKK